MRCGCRPSAVNTWCALSVIGFWVAGCGFRVSGCGFRVAGCGFRVSGFGLWVSGCGFRVSGFGFRVSGFPVAGVGFGFRVSGFGLWVSGCGFRMSGSGFGFRVWCLVFRVSGFGVGVGIRVADPEFLLESVSGYPRVSGAGIRIHTSISRSRCVASPQPRILSRATVTPALPVPALRFLNGPLGLQNYPLIL